MTLRFNLRLFIPLTMNRSVGNVYLAVVFKQRKNVALKPIGILYIIIGKLII